MTDATEQPDNTAVRVALWRALHVEIDAPPHVLVDEIGLQLAAPEPGWQQRRDMDPRWTSRNRASIVARARYVEDLVAEGLDAGTSQYVVLGAGLDTFTQRRPELAARLSVYEIDQPGTQTWKRQRLLELGSAIPDSLRLVPVDFEAGESWVDHLVAAGFDTARPAVVASTGVAVYLTADTIVATMREVGAFAAGSTLAMSFMIPIDLVDADEQSSLHGAERGARAAGTPWISFFTPAEIVELARQAGFATARHVSPAELTQRYFAGRADGLRPSSAEHLLIATS
jgi:methyltransferase (TIGR00027 family)